MAFKLPELPFDKSAFEPHISAKTFEFHHGKHHKAYVDKANDLIKGTDLDGMEIEQAVVEARRKGINPISNNIGQIYNHNIFWQSLTPNNGGTIPEPLATRINKHFGSAEDFKREFVNLGVGQFGSGWVWLVADCGELEIIRTANAETPIICGKTPLLVCDVWEHAYYLDYQNRRADFLQTFIDKLANWEFAVKQYEKDAERKDICGYERSGK